MQPLFQHDSVPWGATVVMVICRVHNALKGKKCLLKATKFMCVLNYIVHCIYEVNSSTSDFFFSKSFSFMNFFCVCIIFYVLESFLANISPLYSLGTFSLKQSTMYDCCHCKSNIIYKCFYLFIFLVNFLKLSLKLRKENLKKSLECLNPQ